MAYDHDLRELLAHLLPTHLEFERRKMFGGLAFLVNGNMCCGVNGDRVVLRLGPQGAADALQQPGVREMDFTGRPLRSMVYLTGEQVASERRLAQWLVRAAEFAATLPPK